MTFGSHPVAPPGFGQQQLLPRDFSSLPQPRATAGSRDNAQFLPFAIERIARRHQQKLHHDQRTCSFCGAPTFELECFHKDHFRWCREHQRPVFLSHRNCGRDYQGCRQVKWEVVHPDWESVVGMSYAAGLGQKEVDNLNGKLFPQEDFPHKYDAYVGFIG
ncbi:hypothetical protein EK21DRAFT_86021 [Setomelanomma holmii]|uniref:Uncharacterized protein n=1 Tax=Setomelanomma holmii TaxID=210430 RepID=A0A9P4LR26_9PLEO|nr:hypothetical protein EK21DRAFT_86021 [Setomelanomma holmii]